MADKPKYYTPAQGRYSQKYMDKNMEQVRFRVKKGEKDVIKAAAERAGQSLAQYIIQAINDREGFQMITPSLAEQEKENP